MELFARQSPAEAFHDIKRLAAKGALQEALGMLEQFVSECGSRSGAPGGAFYVNWAGRALRTCAEICKESEPRRAINYYEDAHKLHQRAGAFIDEAGCLNNAADLYAALGDYSTALSYYQQAYSLIEHTPYGRGHGICLINIAQTLWKAERYGEALKAAETGLGVVADAGDYDREQHFLAAITEIRKSGFAKPATETTGGSTHSVNDAARLVAEQEAQFTTEEGRRVRMLCDAARNLLPMAISGLTEDEMRTVSRVPVTSWPTRSVNAFVGRLSTGDYLINIGPELLVVLFAVSRACYDAMSARRNSRAGANLGEFFDWMRKILVCSVSNRYQFDDAPRLSQAFLGEGLWRHACCWIVLHECGHLLLGHLVGPTTPVRSVVGASLELSEQEVRSIANEFSADLFATERWLRAFATKIPSPDSVPCLLMIAVSVIFSTLTAMRFISGTIRGVAIALSVQRTHPENTERLDRIQSYLSESFPSETDVIAKSRSYIEEALTGDTALALWLSMARDAAGRGMFSDKGKPIGTV